MSENEDLLFDKPEGHVTISGFENAEDKKITLYTYKRKMKKTDVVELRLVTVNTDYDLKVKSERIFVSLKDLQMAVDSIACLYY